MKAMLTLAMIMISTAALAQVTAAPPPSVDWFARSVSILALLVAAAGFAWGRYDKSVERKAAVAAKDPSVDLDITGFTGTKKRDFELKIVNRADVAIALLSMSCAGVRFIPDDAEVSNDGSAIHYNGVRVERGGDDTFIGQLVPPKGGGNVDFVVRIRVNDPVPRVYETRLRRNLRS